MRDYQTKSNVGALPDSNASTKYGAGEATSLRTESKNAVSRAGLILSPQDGSGEDTTQLAQALFINGVGGSSFQSAGTANAITLTPITGANGLLLPPDYTTLDGSIISFFASNTNTSATTASIGQTGGTQFGTKKILDVSGADLSGGEIVAGAYIQTVFDSSADAATGAFILYSGDGGSSFDNSLIHIQDQKSTGTQGGTFTSGSFQTRVLNTVLINEISGASLSSNQVTLPAGTYYSESSAVARRVERHKSQLYDITGATVLLLGENAETTATGAASSALLSGRFSLGVTSLIELQHRCNTTKTTDGFGQQSGFGLTEIYSDLKFWKVG